MPAMSPQIEHFLATLARSGLVQAKVVSALRDKAEGTSGDVEPRHLARYLVDRGYITSAQAQQLLAADHRPEGSAKQAASEDELRLADEELKLAEDELTVMEDPKPAPKPAPPKRAPRKPAPDELEVIEEQPDESAWSKPVRQKRARPQPPPPQPVGPLDGFMQPAPMAPGMQTLGAGPATHVRIGRGKKQKQQGNSFDTKLILMGSAALLVLLALLAALYWGIGRESADDMLAAAQKAYDTASYGQAIDLFGEFIESYPKHDQVSAARVSRGLAQMRQAVESRDYSRALATMNEVLPTLSEEEAFATGRPEIASMAHRLATGLAEKGRLNPSAQLVDEIKAALALCNNGNYVPKALRQSQVLQNVQNVLVQVERDVGRGVALEQAIAAIQAAVAAGNTNEAYRVRNELLNQYPDLAENDRLMEVVRAATQAEQAQVTWTEERRAALTAEPEGVESSTVTLAPTVAGTATGVDGQVVYALSEGAAYGLDATSGRVLWRRYVGFDTEFVPLALQSGAGGDALLVDSERHELVRVGASDGALRWRQPMGDPVAGAPLVLRDRVLVALRNRKLAVVDLASGDALGAFQVPQELRTGASADFKQERYFLAGDHSNLYVFTADPPACREVVYLGHSQGTIAVPPVVMSRWLVVPENTGGRQGLLRVMLTDETGAELTREIQRVPVEGHVHAPPVVAGKSLLVATDLGGLYGYEASTNPDRPFLEEIAAKPGTDARAAARFISVQGAQFWVGDRNLTKYDVQVAQGRFSPKWVRNDGDTFLQPLQMSGDYLFHVRRRKDMPGAAVAAVRASDGAPVWETHLGAPLAGEVSLDGDAAEVTALTATGGLFRVSLNGEVYDAAPAAAGLVDAPRALPADTSLGRFGDALAWCSAAMGEQMLVYDPQAGGLRFVSLAVEVTAPAVALGDALVAPGGWGPVLALDPRSAESVAEPFLPQLAAGDLPAWSRAGVADAGLVLADGLGKLYYLALAAQPRPHLAVRAEIELESPLVSPVAVLGETAYAVDAAGKLRTFALPDLIRGEPIPLGGTLTWGPRRVGERVLLAIAEGQSEKLLCFTGAAPAVWQAPLADGPLAGVPFERQGELLLTSARGAVWTIDAATGAETGRVDIGQPLGQAAVLAQGRIVAPGHDGALHILSEQALRRTP